MRREESTSYLILSQVPQDVQMRLFVSTMQTTIEALYPELIISLFFFFLFVFFLYVFGIILNDVLFHLIYLFRYYEYENHINGGLYKPFIVAHSLGNLMTLYFLSTMGAEWVQQYVGGYIASMCLLFFLSDLILILVFVLVCFITLLIIIY